MRRTMAVHVRCKSLYISFRSSALQKKKWIIYIPREFYSTIASGAEQKTETNNF